MAKKSRFEYSFVDYIIKGYSGQVHVQVASAIQLASVTVQGRHPASKKIIIQSENPRGYSSQYLITLIFNTSTRFHDENWF